MKKVLIVDDNPTILLLLESELQKIKGLDLYFAEDYKGAMKLIRTHQAKFHIALLDLNLPDAPNGEIVKLANQNHIPVIVLSGIINEKLKSSIMRRDIIDFIRKDDRASVKFAVNSVHRILKNYDTQVLIVDDSKTYRHTLKESMKKIYLNILEATDGKEALEILHNNQNISLILTDYEMPNMNGLELTIKVREEFQKDQIAIIAISSVEEQDTITKFLRFGANDFIHKPFSHNEVVTRVNSNLELLDLFSQIKELANKDFLTEMYNRRYFYECGTLIYDKNKRKNLPIAVAMIDIDHFKKINDTYGHNVGDDAIKEVGKILQKNLRSSDLSARFGGEEFCIILEEISLKDVKNVFEKIRICFQNNTFTSNEHSISYTVSIGISFGLLDSLDAMVNSSDKALYIAKDNGRNQVILRS